MIELRSVEMFTGLGGLALGVEEAGFRHLLLVEWDAAACAAVRSNRPSWPLVEGDARRADFRPYADRVEFLAAGAPCQPFSIAGKREGGLDGRDMFPEVFRAMRECRPLVALVENVRGLAGGFLREYFRWVLLSMSFPEHAPKAGEGWREHLRRLEEHATRGRWVGLRYRVHHAVLNAADFGVPQRRERLFVVAFREDVAPGAWRFPAPTHSLAALAWDMYGSGDYWSRHGVRPRPPRELGREMERLAGRGGPPVTDARPWRTVRDAVSDLEGTEPVEHLFLARAYPGHTGSDYDLPAKTLKAGVHGIPGGENAVRFPDGRTRYFTIREAARLQSFPDDWAVPGSLTRAHRLIGNAVPVALARTVAACVREVLVWGASSRREGGADGGLRAEPTLQSVQSA